MDADTGWTAGGCRTSCADGGGAREPASPASGCFKRAIPSIHVGPAQLLDSILGLRAAADQGTVIVAKSNCGFPEMGDDLRVRHDGTPHTMAEYARLARDAGARIIGGCCGTTPARLAAMRDAVERHPPAAAPDHAMIEARLGPLTITAGTEAAVVRAKEGPPPPGRRRRRV